MQFDYKNIDGWFDFELLYEEMVKTAQDGDIFVEIGIWLGKSTIFLANEIKNSGKKITFYAVDNFLEPKEKGYEEQYKKYNGEIFGNFMNNLYIYNVRKYVNIIKDHSVNAAQKFEDCSINFIYIDGGHDYETVFNDIKVWYPKLKTNGTMAGHDYATHAPGVIKAVNEYFGNMVVKNGNTWISEKE